MYVKVYQLFARFILYEDEGSNGGMASPWEEKERKERGKHLTNTTSSFRLFFAFTFVIS